MLTQIVFWTFSALAVLGAAMCITRRSPVASALWLVQTLFALAALFVGLDAQFVAGLQGLVYAGAIMVLFLFVIMLLNLGRPGPSDLKGPGGPAVAALLGGLLFFPLLRGAPPSAAGARGGHVMGPLQPEQGGVGARGRPPFFPDPLPLHDTSRT